MSFTGNKIWGVFAQDVVCYCNQIFFCRRRLTAELVIAVATSGTSLKIAPISVLILTELLRRMRVTFVSLAEASPSCYRRMRAAPFRVDVSNHVRCV